MAQTLRRRCVNSNKNSGRKPNLLSKTVKRNQNRVCLYITLLIGLGAYTYIERSYEEDDNEDTLTSRSGKSRSESDGKSPSPPPGSKLDPSVQELVKLIFDVSIMYVTVVKSFTLLGSKQ